MAKKLEMKSYERDFPPYHFSLEINSYTLLSKAVDEKYESSEFEAGGYKWRLALYPNESINGKDYISLYLAIAKRNDSCQWKVHASFKLFVCNQLKKKYLTFEDANGTISEFNEKMTEWGFAQFLRLKTFNKSSEGYLLNDCCIFGAEVFVHNQNTKACKETLSMVKEPANRTFPFKLENFTKACKYEYLSEEFTVEEKKWKLKVLPHGNTLLKDKSLSIFLKLVDSRWRPQTKRIYVEFKLRLLDRSGQGKHKEETVKHWFCHSSSERGCPSFMPLTKLRQASKKFIKDDTLTVEVEILVISVVNFFSSPRTMLLR